MKTTTALLPALAALFLPLLAQDLRAQVAGAPAYVDYQGTVFDGTTGNPLGSAGTAAPFTAAPQNYTMQFRVFGSQSGTDLIWAETQTVTVSLGNFSVRLGAGASIDGLPGTVLTGAAITNAFGQKERFLELTVIIPPAATGTAITPRLAFQSSPFALVAERAKLADEVNGKVTATAGSTFSGGTFTGGSFAGGTFGTPAMPASFRGTLTGALTGNVTGNVTGNATTAGSATTATTAGSATTATTAGSATTATTAGNVTGIVALGNGGTGSSTKNFVDLTTSQSIAGNKNFTGNVGIGAPTPGVKLDVVGSVNFTMSEQDHPHLAAGDKRGIDNGTTNGWRSNSDYSLSTTSWTTDVSIRADKWIASAYGFVAYSDRRIKRDLQASGTANDLAAIRQLRVTDYRMVDPGDGGSSWRKGFIAQEVEKVIPGAVSRSVEFVPDIFSLATTAVYDPAAKTLALTLDKEHGLKTGDRVRLHMDGKRVDLDVSAVPTAREFVVEQCEGAPEKVLVYGKQVNDFRTVDYDRIFTTAVGALQELKNEKDAEVKALEGEYATLRSRFEVQEKRLAELEAKDTARDAKLAAIETVLATIQAAETPPVVVLEGVVQK